MSSVPQLAADAASRLLIAALAAMPVVAQAAVLTAGSGAGCDHASVQAAITAAAAGDQVRLRLQVFEETVVVSTPLTLSGGFAECGDPEPAGGEVTTLDAPQGSDAPVLTVAPGIEVGLERLIATGAAHAGNGGGLLLSADSAASVDRVLVTGNSAAAGGGAYVGERAVLRARDDGQVTIDGNSAQQGGGLFLAGAAVLDLSASRQASISNNQAGEGAGIYHGGSGKLLLSNALLGGNTAAQDGGALFSAAAPGTPSEIVAVDTDVLENTARDGAGFFLLGNGSGEKALRLERGSFIENRGTGNGGGILASNLASLDLEDVLFQANLAQGSGGALHVDGGQLRVRGGAFGDNGAGEDGGALRVSAADWRVEAEDADLVFAFNFAGGNGGAIQQAGGNGRIAGAAGNDASVRFEHNNASDGGALHVHAGAQLEVDHPVAFEANAALESGGAAAIGDGAQVLMDGGGPLFRRAVFEGNEAGLAGGALHVHDATFQGAWLQVGPTTATAAGEGNSAALGGALGAFSDSTVRLYNSVVAHNAGLDGGGGLFAYEGADVVFAGATGSGPVAPGGSIAPVTGCQPALLEADTDCAEIRSNAGANGAAATAIDATVQVLQAALRDNVPGAVAVGAFGHAVLRDVLVAGHAERALHLFPGGSMLLENATVVDNGSATILVQDAPDIRLEVRNSVLWDNQELLLLVGGSADLDSSCNITQDGRLSGIVVPPLLAQGDRGSYRLRFDSPALDLCFAGSKGHDLDGAPRPQGLRFDAGAFEGAGVAEALFTDGFEAQ